MGGLGAASAAELPKPLTNADFITFDESQARLGQLLFYDKLLSGNRNIACSTCHHHRFASGDALSLGIGEGGKGLGPERIGGEGESRVQRRIPRNAPALWNLGANSVTHLFWDGRLSVSPLYSNGFDSPAEERLPLGLNSVLAAQSLFPVAAQFEMAGAPKENKLAGAAFSRTDKVWPLVVERIKQYPEYVSLFTDAFDSVNSMGDITIVHIANALAAFMGTEWQSFDSPFDRYLQGDSAALSDQQHAGMQLFYGAAGCAQCHSGELFSDQQFYALMLPVFGPGRTRLFDPHTRDVGRMAKTDLLSDAYRFRTPFLRNVALTGPYGHNGAFATLEGVVKHHLDPVASFESWQPAMAELPAIPWLASADFSILEDRLEMARYRQRLDILPIQLEDKAVADIVAFLHALTGISSAEPPLGAPQTVPSGIALD